MIFSLVLSKLIVTALFINVSNAAPTYRYTCSWENSGAGNGRFTSIAMNSCGTKQAALADGTFFYSSDSGSTFSTSPLDANVLAMSSNGSFIIASSLYTMFVSDDYGVTWTDSSNPFPITSVALSSEGEYVLMAGSYGYMTSNDYGMVWDIFSADANGAPSLDAVISKHGLLQIAAYKTNSSYLSFDYGANFLQTKHNDMTPNEQVNSISHNTNYTNLVIATEGALYQSRNLGLSFTSLMSGEFIGTTQSNDGLYHVVTNTSNYYISDDSGFVWTVGDGLPSIHSLGRLEGSKDGEKIMMIDHNEEMGAIYEGRCDWSFNPFVTATVIDHETVIVTVEAIVEVDEILFD